GQRGQASVGGVFRWKRRLALRGGHAGADRRPVDVAHEGIDVRGDVRAEVQVVRVLVYVEHENRGRVDRRLRVVGGDLVPELFRPPAIGQGDPARPMGEGLPRSDEFTPPGPDTPEVLL